MIVKAFDAFRAWQRSARFSANVLADTGNADLDIAGPLHGFVYGNGFHVLSDGEGGFRAYFLNDWKAGPLHIVERWLWLNLAREYGIQAIAA